DVPEADFQLAPIEGLNAVDGGQPFWPCDHCRKYAPNGLAWSTDRDRRIVRRHGLTSCRPAALAAGGRQLHGRAECHCATGHSRRVARTRYRRNSTWPCMELWPSAWRWLGHMVQMARLRRRFEPVECSSPG